eukprot:Hpha_TRINITY_DN354_c0_g1::TRINITY_DN354_c0_g1_i2::g.112757::m.112757
MSSFSARELREKKARCQHSMTSSEEWWQGREMPQASHPYADPSRNKEASGPTRPGLQQVRELPRTDRPHYSNRELQEQRRRHQPPQSREWDHGEQAAARDEYAGLWSSATALAEAKRGAGGAGVKTGKYRPRGPGERRASAPGGDVGAAEDQPNDPRSRRRLQYQKQRHRSDIQNPAQAARVEPRQHREFARAGLVAL